MAIKCANCENDALYTTGDSGVNPVNYCTTCLPYWLENRAAAGHFPLVDSGSKESKKEEVKKESEEESEEDDNV